MNTEAIWSKLKHRNKFYESSYLWFHNNLHLKGKYNMTNGSSPSRRYVKYSPTRSVGSNNGQNNGDGQGNIPRKSSWIWSVWGDKSGTKSQMTQQQQEPPTIHFRSSQSSLKSEMPPMPVDNNLEEEYAITTDSRRRSELAQEEQQEPKRTWRFWSTSSGVNDIGQDPRNEVDQAGLPPKAAISLTNTWIPASDVIVYKSAAAKRDLKNQADTREPDIVVPSFDILPQKNVWNSLKSSALGLAHQWNVVTGARTQKCIYQQGPQAKLKQLSMNGKKNIKVLIVGVHGFFPTKMIRPFIGEPTGTSLKFVAEAEEVVKEYFKKHNQEVDISKIALEREGEIFERVNFFFDVMKNWSKEINQADFIYFVCHSQGSPVTMLLLAQLIDAGLINLDNTRFFNEGDVPFSTDKKIISILAMAGINNGPFYGADQTLFVRAYQRIEKESLRELFQFQKPDSLVSQRLIRSIRIIVGSNVKIVFVGSINDQLVPLYSSMCLFASHPNFFRATFIDRSSRTPDFIMRLVNIAGTLLNLGYDEHGIIKEISPALAGTLTGGGHSSVYNEAQVYELGLKFALETTDVATDIPVKYRPYKLEQLSSNPYHLPWCMRGLMYEIGHHLDPDDITRLFQEFENWEPETKALKDVKYRLTGLKNTL